MSLPELKDKKTSNADYRLVRTEAELASLVEELEQADMIAVDTETEGLEYDAVIVGVCLSTRAGTGYYVPIRHTEWEGVLAPNQLPPTVVFDALRHALENRPCVGHNIKFDQQMLWKDGIHCNFVDDTLAIAKLFGHFASNGLKQLVLELLNHEMSELDSLFPKVGTKKPEIRPATLSPEEICDYAVEDANWTLQLRDYLYRMIPGLADHPIYKIEMALLPVVGEMEAFGIPVSKTFLIEQGKICSAYEERLEREIIKEVRDLLQDPEYTVNFGSPKQLAELLYQHLKLPVQTDRKSGNPSTNKDALAELAKLNPVAARIQTLRTMGKLNGTYLTGLLDKVHSDGRIRASFNQLGTDTGRFSSSKPNLQNLPRTQTFFLWDADDQALAGEFLNEDFFRQRQDGRFEFYAASKDAWVPTADEIETYQDGEKTRTRLATASDGKTYGIENGLFKEVWRCPTRDFVAASPGHYLIEADYSQIELRIMAGETREPTLMNAYLSGEDVHTATAATIYQIRPEDVTDNQRQVGKTINFSLLYGAGAPGVALLLGISKQEAQSLIDRYFQNLNKVGEWIDTTKAAARRDRMATTNLGRVRRFPHITSGDNFTQAKSEREAVNFKIQGAAADVMKLALVRTASRLREYFGDKAKLVSTVHDSAMVEVHESIAIEDLMAVLKEAMVTGINAAKFTSNWPDFAVDVKKGASWAAAKDVKWPEQEQPLPPKFTDDLPKILVRKVALERDLGLVASPTASTGLQQDIFAGLMGAEPAPPKDTAWVIELMNPLSSDQLTGLQEFLTARSAKQHPGAPHGTVKVLVPDGQDGMKEISVPGKFALSFEGNTQLRIKIGNCTLRQELDDIDPSEVLRGVDFGL